MRSASRSRSAAEGEPENIRVWIALGWCHKRTGRIDLAIEALETAMAADPEEALIRYNLACYSCQLGYLNEARMWLEWAFDLAGKQEVRWKALEDKDLEPLWTKIGEL